MSITRGGVAIEGRGGNTLTALIRACQPSAVQPPRSV